MPSIVDLGAVLPHPAVERAKSARAHLKKDSTSWDYARWSFVAGMVAGCDDLLDVGIGMGQFPDAMNYCGIARIRGVDYRKHSLLTNETGFEFVIHDITDPPQPDLQAQVVTCMECIEHIPDPQFSAAVAHLKAMARERLIVTVPFEEPIPLPSFHHQRFDQKRLSELFPGSDLILLAKAEKVRWALVDWRRNGAL